MGRWTATLVAIGLAMGISKPASALVIRGGTSGGLMQQPTSHYYHAVYGGYLDVSTDGGGFVTRVSYVERPRFHSAGFVDQEMGAFASVGSLVAGKADGGLFAFFGAGRMAGYVRTEGEEPERRRGYSIPGPTATLEYTMAWGGFTVAANHQTFIGYVDRTELDARVAWPFNFFQLQMGFTW